MRKKSKNRKLIIILMILVAFISVGYAAISSNLQINGLTTIQKQTWDVHFENVKLKEGSVNVIPQITSPTNVEYSVELDKPGDYHEFIVDVVNAGTIDAMIDSLDVKPNLTNEQKKYIDFSVTYENGNAITSKQLLSSGETKKVKVSLKYKDDITSKDLPDETTTLDVSIKDNYIQASDSAVEVHDKNYLMVADPTNSEEIPAFNGPILKNQIEKVYTLDTLNIPENAIASWDVSENQNGSIMAYTLDEDNNGMYEIYLAQDGGVLANPDSTKTFRYFTNADLIDMGNLDTSNVLNMKSMFSNCVSLHNLDLSNFITSKVIDMSGMFYYCSSLTNLDLKKFNTSNVKSMTRMFDNCTSLTSLNLNNFDTSNVTDMSRMFRYCEALPKIDGINYFDTSNVTNFFGMFVCCESMKSLNLNNFDTSSAIDMSAMFEYCTGLEELIIDNFDTSNVIDMSWMFNNCNKLTHLDISSFDTSKVNDIDNIFLKCKSLKEILVGPKWIVNDGISTDYMFSGAGVSSVTLKQ